MQCRLKNSDIKICVTLWGQSPRLHVGVGQELKSEKTFITHPGFIVCALAVLKHLTACQIQLGNVRLSSTFI